MTHNDMVVGKLYIVTKSSDDGTFLVGDAIKKLANGSVVNQQAEGWLEQEDLAEAAMGMECQLDTDRIQRRKDRLLQQLAELEADDD